MRFFIFLTTIVFGLSMIGLSTFAVADGPATAPSAPPAVGDKAKDFTLKDLEGKPLALSDLTQKGPVVLIQLRGWVGYQCPICTKQVADFMAKREAIEAAGAQVVLLYPGPAKGLEDHAKDFISGKGLPASFHFLLDPDLTVVDAYNVRWNAPRETAYPSTFVIDKTGVIRFVKISHNHGDRATSAEVLEVLKGLK